MTSLAGDRSNLPPLLFLIGPPTSRLRRILPRAPHVARRVFGGVGLKDHRGDNSGPVCRVLRLGLKMIVAYLSRTFQMVSWMDCPTIPSAAITYMLASELCRRTKICHQNCRATLKVTMKHLLSLVALATLAIGITACSQSSKSTNSQPTATTQSAQTFVAQNPCDRNAINTKAVPYSLSFSGTTVAIVWYEPDDAALDQWEMTHPGPQTTARFEKDDRDWLSAHPGYPCPFTRANSARYDFASSGDDITVHTPGEDVLFHRSDNTLSTANEGFTQTYKPQ